MNKLKVLIAEDDRGTRRKYEEDLVKELFEIEFVADGQTALERYRAEKPDLLVLDIMMPNKNGYQVLQDIRKSDKDSPTVIVIVSALGAQDQIKACLDLGVQGYLLKPVKLGELNLKLLEFYGKKYPEKTRELLLQIKKAGEQARKTENKENQADKK